jgi:hypothetical protein
MKTRKTITSSNKAEFVMSYVLTQVLKSMRKDKDGKFYDNGDILLMLEPDEMDVLKKIGEKFGVRV